MMDEYGQGMTNEYGMSVDDILSEFRLEQQELAARAIEDSFLPPERLETGETAWAAPAVDEEGVRLYTPKSAAVSHPTKPERPESAVDTDAFPAPAYEEVTEIENQWMDDAPMGTEIEDEPQSEDYEDYEQPRQEKEKPAKRGGMFSALFAKPRKGKKKERRRAADYEEEPEYGEASEYEAAPEYAEELYDAELPQERAPAVEEEEELYGDSFSYPADAVPEEAVHINYEPRRYSSLDDLDPALDEILNRIERENRSKLDMAAANAGKSQEWNAAPEISSVSQPGVQEPRPDFREEFVPAAGEQDDADDFSRFSLYGEGERSMYYDGQELDLSPDEDYEAPGAQEQYASPEKEGRKAARQPEAAPKARKKFSFSRKEKKKKRPLNAPLTPEYEDEGSFAAQFRDYNAAPSDYADPGDYDFDRDQEAETLPQSGDFPSFREYLAGLVTGLLFRIRRAPGEGGATMEEDQEDLGTEVPPVSASKYYGSFVHSMRLRFRICLVLLLFMSYISLGLPLPGSLKTLPVQAGICLAMQLTIMLLSLDVVTGAAINTARGRFGADSLAVFCCLVTSIDALAVAVDGFGSLHMPLCVLSSLSLTGVLLASLLSARGLRKALRVPAIGKRAYGVTGEVGLKGKGTTLLKSARSSAGFVRRSEEAPPDETLFLRAAPAIAAVAIPLAMIVCIVKKSWAEFLFIYSALISPAVPVCALLCFALPFFIGSNRIFSSGAAIAGWSGLCDVGESKNLIVTDRDLFPEGSVELERVRIFADAAAEKIISYAGTMVSASGSGIAACFAELMEKNGGTMRHVENFEYLAGGGMKGIIDGETVLCGSLELMRLMNVRVPYKLVDKTTVLLAIDGVLYGIFNMKYTAQPQVRKALVNLMRSNRHPIFAIRDFNVNPEMLRQSFDVATDGYDFPPYVERFAISEATPGKESKLAAVVCREGLGPLTHMADTGRSMYIATRINLLITMLSSVIGILAVFVKFLGAGFVAPGFLLGFMLLWAIPVVVISVFLKF